MDRNDRIFEDKALACNFRCGLLLTKLSKIFLSFDYFEVEIFTRLVLASCFSRGFLVLSSFLFISASIDCFLSGKKAASKYHR